MTDQEIQASNLPLNFDGVEEAQGSNMTEPGIIGMFTITEGEFISSKSKGTPGVKFTFEEEGGSSFNHTFWLKPKALNRIQHLAKHAAKTSLSGSLQPAQLIAMFKGKVIPMKITAQINVEKGRVYPDLPYGGFTAESIDELKFNPRELEEIEKGKNLTAVTNVNNADDDLATTATGTETPGTSAEADDF